ncbi:metallophosphoesterase family protein [Paraflavitalea sp. CAU 1676]|uniref:purple acid phosphatase family protein n=1 Tax=Paraflavitalea sp. CAU 1676 TaxID=3032598 RepID=UPI0023DB3048|nr:metallophosphoesterase family protein [Paraflavitalea sp. CAU 1676]MDF2189157.1 metallophosphoesterase family protein [Paraflavitalea sp. CAU 1676]
MSDATKNPLDRRSFLGTLTRAGALGTAALTPLATLAGSADEVTTGQPAAVEHIFLAKPYLQAVSPTSMSIRFITALPSYSWVEYGVQGSFDKKAHAITDGMVNANNRIHEIVVDGLTPGLTYNYRVVSKEIKEFKPYNLTYGTSIQSDTYQFSTIHPAAKEVSWLIFNDIHDRPASFAHLMGLNKENPYDFVFLNGDMFDYQTDEQQIIDHLLTPCTSCFATGKPMMFVRGNHETRGKYARNLKDYFTNPGGQYFSFQWGPVFAMALDTGEDKEDEHPVYAGIVDFDHYRVKQAAWLEQQLQSKACKKAKYRVVMMHIPPHYSGNAHGTLHCRELFSPLFDKYKVDIVIAGHTHTYGVHPPVAGTHNYPLIIGGGPKEGNRTLIRVKADQQALTLQMLKDDGAEVGRYEVIAKR